jgi:hypothetical protein
MQQFRNGQNIHAANKDGSMSKRTFTRYESINLAKKASHKIQSESRGLGRGAIKVV